MLPQTSDSSTQSLFSRAGQCIACTDPTEKCRLTEVLLGDWEAGALVLADATEPAPIGEPGRPARPRLVMPRQLPRRRPASREGRAALLHALAHIEFNAINLALDAVYRFRGMPRQFYADWLKVAGEEACHFGLLRGRLRDLGYEYGDFDAHDGLWEMARKTAHDVMVRMALVPRVLEARGLDVTPAMIDRLKKSGDDSTVAVLGIILRDEIGHVEIGTRWFRYACGQRGLDAQTTFRDLLVMHMKGRVKGPFHYEARGQAGFTADEMRDLERLAGMIE